MPTTLASPATISGITLFTAVAARLTMRPPQKSEPPGIWFRRVDLAGSPPIPVAASNVVLESRHTALAAGAGSTRVHTVEHVLSALVGAGVTDVVIELEGPEVPIADGSAEPFRSAIEKAGLTAFTGPERAPIRITHPIEVKEGNARITAVPSTSNGARGCRYEYHLEYGADSPLKPQHAAWDSHDRAGYAKGVAPARTYCLLHEAQALRKMGLFGHLEPRDMLVIGEDGAPIENTLRFPDEPARHKLLDLIGDLALAGRPIIGTIRAERSGHALNHVMAARLAELA